MLDFKGHRFEPDIILTSVRGYLAYPLSDRNLEEMLWRSEGLKSIIPAFTAGSGSSPRNWRWPSAKGTSARSARAGGWTRPTLIPIRFQDETNHGTSVPWPDHDESTKCWLGKQVTPSRALRAWWRFGGHKRFSCLPSWGQPLSKPLRCLASPGLPCPDCRRDFGRACKPEHHHLVGEDAVGH